MYTLVNWRVGQDVSEITTCADIYRYSLQTYYIARDLLSTPMKQVPFDGSFSKLARAAFALRRFAWKRFIRSPEGSIFPLRIFPSDECYFFSLVSSPATGNNDKSSQLFPMTVWINRASKISEHERKNFTPRFVTRIKPRFKNIANPLLWRNIGP